jgi:hypothetical protein
MNKKLEVSIRFWEGRSDKAKRLYNDAYAHKDHEDMQYYRNQFNECEKMLNELYLKRNK